MLATCLGLVVALAPLLAAPMFGGRLRGTVTVASLAVAWHLAVALVTQAAGVFTYPVVLGAHLAAGALLLALAWRRRALGFWLPRIGWFPAAALALAAAFLVSVHFWYAGPAETYAGLEWVERSASPYPFYSDEWIAVVLAKWSIATRGLPIANPLDGGSPFPNFLAGFHALVAEALLLLGLDPLSGYAWLAIANGVAVVCLVFALLRRFGLGAPAAAAAAASAVFVTNAGNLPGIWNLMPFTLALALTLLALVAALCRARLAAAAAFAAALAVYPPAIVFALPAAAGAALDSRAAAPRWRSLALWAALPLAGLAAAFAAAALARSPSFALDLGFGFVARPRLDPGYVTFWPWNVLPLYLVPFAALGVWEAWRRRAWALLAPVAAASAVWLAYGVLGNARVVVIEPARAVAVAGILLAAASGFGFARAGAWLSGLGANPTVAKLLALGLLGAFAVGWPWFGTWAANRLAVERPDGAAERYLPAPPVTRHLAPDEVRLFVGRDGERLVAPPWKGLVLAAAAGVRPLESKTSTLAARDLLFADFFAADCPGRRALAARHAVDLVYAPPFACDGFTEIGRGAEGLALYDFSTAEAR